MPGFREGPATDILNYVTRSIAELGLTDVIGAKPEETTNAQYRPEVADLHAGSVARAGLSCYRPEARPQRRPQVNSTEAKAVIAAATGKLLSIRNDIAEAVRNADQSHVHETRDTIDALERDLISIADWLSDEPPTHETA